MPKKLERQLKARAKKMGLGKKRTGAYIYGTMRKTGWKPGQGGGGLEEKFGMGGSKMVYDRGRYKTKNNIGSRSEKKGIKY